MLIIVPPSEAKARTPAAGPPVDLDALSFPELTPTRLRVIEAVAATSEDSEALRRLHVRPSFSEDVARNTALLERATRPAREVYTGPLHAGLDLAGLSEAGSELADRTVVINSALWGLLRPNDWIPTYRVHVFAHLLGPDGNPIGRMDRVWKSVVPDVLAKLAGTGLVVDLRSGSNQMTGRATGHDRRTVTLRVEQNAALGRIGDVVAKRVRGQAAHHLLEHVAATATEPRTPDELAAILGERWPVELEGPRTRGPTWTLTLFATD
jgi:uncharacterized protein